MNRTPRCALSIAGSDPSGGAGMQADLKTFSALGVFGMSVITSVVAENTFHVIDSEDVRPDMIASQIDAVFEDIPPDAVKIGMLSCVDTMMIVSTKLKELEPKNVVVDPVMYAKNGAALMDPGSIDTLIANIIPLADIITPNIPETEKIAGLDAGSIASVKDMEHAAKLIYDMGCKHVLVKGGHAIGDATDVLYDGNRFYYYSHTRINTKNTHGTGCTLSSAIASYLALGDTMPEAVKGAKEYVSGAIDNALELGCGCGPTNHFWNLGE
ncbi:MAG: bifunctional hydroxymethylpyrimidine kinase/phosphomethylpyrimidine kinase [Coriobacteriales bacterium]|jgi:hydroxymethylpyrimidine/phosphomethylpyrimidine kinase|nr:bifunctional hydroxymethylpyrimidine kinase/phosphomethylpyrimidine kinase [Coriobacteriales bacterium]